MFNFNGIENNKEEAISLVNKMITDEINYINKLCFIYSYIREQYPNVFEENLKVLLVQLNVLKELKKELSDSVENIYDRDLNKEIKSLSEIKILSENIISNDMDETIDCVVEESEVNSLSLEDKIGYLQEIDEIVFETFISNIRDINEESVNYIVRSIAAINRSNKHLR